MKEKWTGKVERPIRVYTDPKLTDDIYLHFSEILKKIKYYAPQIKGKVLDVGAGNSPYRKFFSGANEYIKLDKFKYPGIDITADITKRIPYKDNSIDNIVCIQVIEHITDPQKAVNEMHRILKKGGKCLVTTHMAAPIHGAPYDYYRFTIFGLQEIFKKFKKVEIKANGGTSLSIMQLIVWGISEKLPRFIALPIIIFMNIIGKFLDKILYTEVFTLNYSVFAEK